ncbi:MAG: glycosyltransferase family 2 protein [Sporocytophaga sp.]|uniref:glycosyltransferase family 2 protein n=1 Tax=Sporocytophaga sp. TaxID=2231183 RepID=UPI001B10DBF0|nr:glycosyltransferase family 2 protein [Sporocytophaga sp.]MBO9701647.1 glycosyltransferase family 2 protein [Sporocytophaga sp.]
MLLSVIIPAYNRAHIIKDTLNSVLNQRYTNFELIFVDDASTDHTEEIIKAFNDQRITFIKKTVNYERGAARNTGTMIAQGDYITFIDSDDIFYEDHLLKAVEHIKRFNLPEVFCQRYEVKNEGGRVLWEAPVMDEGINEKLIEGNFLSCNGVFLRRDIAQRNLFCEERKLSGLEDWELWLRLAPKYRFLFSNEITSSIINHSQRSVYEINYQRLIERFDIFMDIILSNKDIVNFYRGKIHKLKASCDTYISLHLAISKKQMMRSLFFLLKGFFKDPAIMFKRRFYAIVKHLF